MTAVEFVKAWLHANPVLALQYFKNWFTSFNRWHMSRHRKAIIAQRKLGHFHVDRYYTFDGKRLGVDFYIHLGASLDLYHSPGLEALGYAYPNEPYLRYKAKGGE
jgi:hypothetical protein